MIAEMAVADPSTGTNPVKLTKKAALEILENTIEGKL
jgi:alcohol dehydrogenase class IV